MLRGAETPAQQTGMLQEPWWSEGSTSGPLPLISSVPRPPLSELREAPEAFQCSLAYPCGNSDRKQCAYPHSALWYSGSMSMILLIRCICTSVSTDITSITRILRPALIEAELAWLAKEADFNSTSCGSFGISTQSLCSPQPIEVQSCRLMARAAPE
jgi:hypothetical protein